MSSNATSEDDDSGLSEALDEMELVGVDNASFATLRRKPNFKLVDGAEDTTKADRSVLLGVVAALESIMVTENLSDNAHQELGKAVESIKVVVANKRALGRKKYESEDSDTSNLG